MLFKLFTVATAFASIDELATCTIGTTPSTLPDPAGSLQEEFILIFNREYANALPPGASIRTGATAFTGPDVNNLYTVTKTQGALGLTPDDTRAIMRSWQGQTFAGADQVGVASWFINSVAC
ncbi:hypothetical protein NMY22_g14411 [Coprinellus aureogranulatus]|nr:hypothetical protein NMY22_g14411 [Coprinellus aureogranulatus]